MCGAHRKKKSMWTICILQKNIKEKSGMKFWLFPYSNFHMNLEIYFHDVKHA